MSYVKKWSNGRHNGKANGRSSLGLIKVDDPRAQSLRHMVITGGASGESPVRDVSQGAGGGAGPTIRPKPVVMASSALKTRPIVVSSGTLGIKTAPGPLSPAPGSSIAEPTLSSGGGGGGGGGGGMTEMDMEEAEMMVVPEKKLGLLPWLIIGGVVAWFVL